MGCVAFRRHTQACSGWLLAVTILTGQPADPICGKSKTDRNLPTHSKHTVAAAAVHPLSVYCIVIVATLSVVAIVARDAYAYMCV